MQKFIPCQFAGLRSRCIYSRLLLCFRTQFGRNFKTWIGEKKHLSFISFPPHHKSSKIPVIVHFLGFEFTVEFRPFSRASDTLFQASNFCPNIQLQEKLAFFLYEMLKIFQLWCQNSNMSKNKVLSKLNFWTKIRLLE